MARLPRVIAIDVPHHVTQRGNARQVVFASDADRLVYLDLLRRNADLHGLSVLGYCLMSNHVHLITVPHTRQALAQALKHTHGRYAAYWNAHQGASGHVWQGRYYSCPLDASHLWSALRYAELNPVRAGLVTKPQDWKWSSAAAHCGGAEDTMLEMETWRKRWTVPEWMEYLSAKESATDLASLRQSTHTGRPLGSAEFVHALEETTLRLLAPQKGGRPKKVGPDTRQSGLAMIA